MPIIVSLILAPLAVRGQDDLVPQAALERAGLGAYWKAGVPVPVDDKVEASHLVDDALYVFTAGGVVFSIQAETGLIRWAEKLSDRNFAVLKPAHLQHCGDARLAALMTTAETFIIDRYSGRILKRFSIDFPIGGPPVGVGGTLIAGSSDGHLRSVLWANNDPSSAQVWWVVRAGGPITTQPILTAGNQIIVASHGGQVFSCAAQDKSYQWGFDTGGAVKGNPYLFGGSVYVASANRSLYKIDASDGRMYWRYRTGSPLNDGPIVVDDVVYQYVSQEGLIGIDAGTGSKIRQFPKAKSFVASVGENVALWNGLDQVLFADRASGKIVANIPTGNATVVQNLQHDAIYLIGSSGQVLCIRPEGAPYLHPQQMAAARAQLNRAPRSIDENNDESVTDVEDDGSRLDPLRSRRDR